MKKSKNEHFVLGYGKFGSEIIKTLHDNGYTVVAIDANQQLIDKNSANADYAICLDTTDLNQLKETGIANAASIVVAISDVQVSILTCANLIELGAKGNIIARAINMVHKRVLMTMGIQHVTVPEIEVGKRVALQAMYGFDESVHSLTSGFSWTKLVVSHNELNGKMVQSLEIRKKYGATILFIKRDGQNIFPVNPDTKILLGDTIAIMCPDNNLSDVIDYFVDPLFKSMSRGKIEDEIVRSPKKNKNGK